MKKESLINLYWILDAMQKGDEPNLKHVGECFVSIRDELMLPDTEEIVLHIREVLERSQATADVLAERAIDRVRAAPLSEEQLLELMRSAASIQLPDATLPVALAVAFGRLVEAAHGIRP